MSDSAIDAMVETLARLGPEGAALALEEWFESCSVVELAGLWHDWPSWARQKQLPPMGAWRSWGFLTGRGFGKTAAVSRYVNREAMSGRAMLIVLLAQDEQSAVDLQVKGPSGLIATSRPNEAPEWIASELQLVWPNGARAYVRTPEVPGKIRGLEYQLAWTCELQSWPVATREEAWSNVLLSTRLGYARTVWDCTPNRGHPILLELLARASAEPNRHHVVRGTTYENADNLGDGYVEDLETKYKGTTRGREELDGEMLGDAEGATVKLDVIRQHVRAMPARFARRIISVDPATTTRAGSDTTGLVDMAQGLDGSAYVIADLSGKHAAEAWAKLVVDRYLSGRCDCVVVETNKGGDLVAQNLRSDASPRGIKVSVLAKGAIAPAHNPRIIYVREVYARGDKAERARPVGTAYERGRVHHVEGVDLTSLEATLTTWVAEPGRRTVSPGDLDALVHGAVELLGLASNEEDPKAGFVGYAAASARVASPAAAPPKSSALSRLYARRGGLTF